MKFLSVDLVLLIAKRQCERFGGAFGVRDMGLLESTVAAAEFASYYGSGLIEAAVKYLHIAKNHPLVDGNKRTGAAAMLLFLDLNGVTIAPIHQEALTELVLGFVENRVSEEELVHAIRTRANLSNGG